MVLAKLFNLMMQSGNVPPQFSESHTVPIIKKNYNVYNKSITVDDFRVISGCIESFEHCILDRYGKFFFITSDNQFVIDHCMLLFGCPSVLTVVNKHKAKTRSIIIFGIATGRAFFKSDVFLCLGSASIRVI